MNFRFFGKDALDEIGGMEFKSFESAKRGSGCSNFPRMKGADGSRSLTALVECLHPVLLPTY
jgi:hypothetical protein